MTFAKSAGLEPWRPDKIQDRFLTHHPRTMKEPDPTDDLDQTILDTFDEMHAEAQITPIFLTFPAEVIESVEAYAKENSLEPATIVPRAIVAMEFRVR